jgi:hypothetical protein
MPLPQGYYRHFYPDHHDHFVPIVVLVTKPISPVLRGSIRFISWGFVPKLVRLFKPKLLPIWLISNGSNPLRWFNSKSYFWLTYSMLEWFHSRKSELRLSHPRWLHSWLLKTRWFHPLLLEMRLFHSWLLESRWFYSWLLETRLFHSWLLESRWFYSWLLQTRSFHSWLLKSRWFHSWWLHSSLLESRWFHSWWLCYDLFNSRLFHSRCFYYRDIRVGIAWSFLREFVCCQTRISKEWSPICLKETNNYARWGSSTLL